MPRKWLAPVVILIFVLFCFFYYSLFLDRLSNTAYDILLRISAGKPERNIPVALVTATEKFSHQIGHEPNRKDYAELINLLNESRIIVSDIFFPSVQSEETDRMLKDSFVARSEKIILPVFTPYKLKKRINNTGYRVDILIENHPYFQSAVEHLGHINVFPDSDTIVRKCPAFIVFGQRWFPHISLKALSISGNKQDIKIKKFSGFKKANGIIPVDDDGCFLIRFLKPQAVTEMIYPMEDVLSGKVKPDVFRDKIVVVGHTIMGTKNADLIPTPFGMQFGALVQMQALYTIFSGTYIWKMSRESTLAIMIFALFLFLAVFSSPFWKGTRFFIVAIIALFYVSFFLFKYHNFFFDPVPMALASSFSYISFACNSERNAFKSLVTAGGSACGAADGGVGLGRSSSDVCAGRAGGISGRAGLSAGGGHPAGRSAVHCARGRVG
ncbi:MAG: CHASE2 domain-containing protein [Candidatus Omnitrophica bacterium]|nr:CHASE2 domain-containing protein [Candidatus Omnitrophota bacterium]